MKPIHYSLSICALALGLCTATSSSAAEGRKKSKENASASASASGELVKVTEKDAAWAAKARAAYPLKVCLTSDEKLGAMGENAEFIYREKGKPDRLVVFCCEGCEDDFKKEPAKYVAKLDAAAKQKSAK
jgi:YHS domain-containing protein